MKNFILILVMVLCVSCTTKKTNGEPKLNAMEKFFDCLGDSSKCKDIMNKEQKKNFEEQIK